MKVIRSRSRSQEQKWSKILYLQGKTVIMILQKAPNQSSISRNQCEIKTLVLLNNRKSHTKNIGFKLVPKKVTMNGAMTIDPCDLEGS